VIPAPNDRELALERPILKLDLRVWLVGPDGRTVNALSASNFEE